MKIPPNYYKLLGITPSATENEIRTAFRSKILQFHHDKTPDDPSDLCYQIIAAYRTLSNRDTRLKYDIQRDKDTQPLTDSELIERYKNDLPRNEQNELQITPVILAELRHAHNRHRQEANEEFTPAAAICYDVTNLLSTQFKSDIAKWEKEFKADAFSDNFFLAYQGVMEEIMRHDTPNSHCPNFWCELCHQNFISETHHYQAVLMPYLNHFGITDFRRIYTDRITPLYQFLCQAVGEWFQWEPEPLPEIPEVWNMGRWTNLLAICIEVSAFVWELPNPEHFNTTDQHVTYVQKCTWAKDGIIRWICWVLLNSDMISLNSKAQELLEEDALGELFVYIGVLKEFLGFDVYDWGKLRSSSLDAGEFKMTLLWTLVMVKLDLIGAQELVNFPIVSGMLRNKTSKGMLDIFFRLGLTSSTDATLDSICDHFVESGDHLSAISYYVQHDSLSSLFTKYSELCHTKLDVAQVYRKVFYSQKLKSILPTLGEESGMAAGLEEIVEIVQLILEDPSPAFKLLVQMFPERLGEPEFYPIHSRAIEGFSTAPLSSSNPYNSFQLILAACHFLGDENEVDEDFLQFHSRQSLKSKLAGSLSSYDFETLAEVLAVELNSRNVAGAEELLAELNLESEGVSNHTRAMSLMISGSIHKVNKNWLGAITDFQEALLNTPELNYRLTPSISRLSQDFELHQGILDAVAEKLQELDKNFKEGRYVDFPQEDDPVSMNSLIISHPTPLYDFRYSEMSGKIQSEEPKPSSNEDAVECSTQLLPPANTPNVTLEKCERAIELGDEKPLVAVDAACAYLDLLESLPPHMRHGPIVMAASHFLRAMETAPNLNAAFAYRNSILELASRLLQLDQSNQARIQSCLTHKHMFSILLLANQCLSKWPLQNANKIIPEGAEGSNALSAEICEKSPFTETELISNLEKTVIEKLLKSVVGFTKVEPLLNIPSLTSSDLGYVEKVKTQFLHHFCAEKVTRSSEAQLAPIVEHAYTLFLEVLHGRNLAVSFETSKRMLMDSILRKKGIRMENLVHEQSWALGPSFNDDGWTDSSQPRSLQFHRQLQTFESIEGFKLHLATGQISFLLSKDGQGVFSREEMFEIFQNGCVAPSLKLSISDFNEFNPNPFKRFQFEPSTLAGTSYLKTMLRISRLLMTLMTGMEVNAHAPFLTREVEIGFLDSLPEHLQHFLRPLRERTAATGASKKENVNGSAHAFSLNLTHCYYEETEDEEELVFSLGDAHVELTCAEDPISLDSNHNEEFSPSKSFVQDFNQNFHELGKYFPEFRRLTELSKISFICVKLSQILISGSYSPHVANGIRSLGLNLNVEDEGSEEDTECHLIPSPSCHSHPHVVNTTASVIINPLLVYGPVYPSPGSIFITLEELLEEPAGDFEIEATDENIMYEVSTTVTVYLRKEFRREAFPQFLQNDPMDDTKCQVDGKIDNNNASPSDLYQLQLQMNLFAEDEDSQTSDSSSSEIISNEIVIPERILDIGHTNKLEGDKEMHREIEQEDIESQATSLEETDDDGDEMEMNSENEDKVKIESMDESSEEIEEDEDKEEDENANGNGNNPGIRDWVRVESISENCGQEDESDAEDEQDDDKDADDDGVETNSDSKNEIKFESTDNSSEECEEDEDEDEDDDGNEKNAAIRDWFKVESISESCGQEDEQDEDEDGVETKVASEDEVNIESTNESSEDDDEYGQDADEIENSSAVVKGVRVELTSESSEEDEDDDDGVEADNNSRFEGDVRITTYEEGNEEDDLDDDLPKNEPLSSDEDVKEMESSSDEESVLTDGGDDGRMETIPEGNEDDCSSIEKCDQSGEAESETEDETNVDGENVCSDACLNLTPVELPFNKESSPCLFTEEFDSDSEESQSETEADQGHDDENSEILNAIRYLWD